MKAQNTLSLLTTISLSALVGFTLGVRQRRPTVQHTIEIDFISSDNSIEELLDAIVVAEGGDRPGDEGESIGIYQIKKIYVDDVNRILGEEKYTYEDRNDPVKSREMVRILTSYYGSYWYLGRYPTTEDKARIHNGGPDGWQEARTSSFWGKVRNTLNDRG